MNKLKQWWKKYYCLLLAVAAFITAALRFLQVLFQGMDGLVFANAVLLAAVGWQALGWYHDGGPSKK